MNLPFVIDVAVGLIFIFLILSLLASEIQELLTTLLQWRAKHLKNSIEILLAGGVGTQQEDEVRDVVQKLYDDPLIKNINQEAKGWWASRIRAVTRLSQSSFGKNQTTGPSYIAPETFATSLLERVGLADLSHMLVEVRLQAFAARIIGLDEAKPDEGSDDGKDSPEKSKTEIPDDPDLLRRKGKIRQIAEKTNQPNLNEDSSFQLLVEEFSDVLENFKAGETSLVTAVERMEESFDAYINSYLILIGNGASSQTQDSDLTYFVKRLKTFKLSTFGSKGERAIKFGGLRPSLLEIAELADKSSDTYREIVNNYKRLIVKGKKLDKIVLPRLKDELLTTQIEVMESQLTVKHLAEIEDQLKVKHLGITKAFEKKLKANSDKSTKHLVHLKPISLRRYPRLDEFETKSPLLDAKFGQALACPIKPVRCRRSLFRPRSWFAHRRRKDVFIARQMKQLKQERQQIVAEILDRLPETARQELVTSILDKLNSEELYGDVEKGSFGLIDCVLDRLPDRERCFLADRVLIALGQEKEWSENLEKEQRSLYKNYQAYKTTQQILEKLPDATKESLVILARRAQTRAQRAGSDIDQFREEVAVWFDRSMSRASGVYKRNAKGVGILIGLSLVVTTNVDVGFIVDRLSNDQSLRNVIAERAISITGENMTLDKARADTNEALKELGLPIGWNPSNVADQLNCSLPNNSPTDPPWDWSKFYQVCLGNKVKKPQAFNNPVKSSLFSVKTWLKNSIIIVLKYPWGLLRIFLGWLIAGIAISMGAPFWFDLLGKVVNVRNTGGKPPSVGTQPVVKPVK